MKGFSSCGYAALVTVMLGAVTGGPLVAQTRVAAAVESRVQSVLDRTVTIELDRVKLKAAIDAIAATAKIRLQYQSEMIDAVAGRVTVRATKQPLREVFGHILEGTNLQLVALDDDFVAIQNVERRLVNGGVVGKVLDAKTKRPLRGARVRLDGDTRGVVTAEDGAFRFASVASGAHKIEVRMLGYGRQSHDVTVTDGESSSIDFALEGSVNALDQVVVTGTVVATELKAVPNAMTIVTAKDIERRGITRIDQLFRGEVPGLFAINSYSPITNPLGEVSVYSRGATELAAGSPGTLFGTNPIKTYVDGVEMADPRYLSQIDPRSIERIEILTGPQASTIYGSNAVNGVMQVFTKRGTTARPQLTLHLQSGIIQNNLTSNLAPQHVYDGSVAGVEGRMSYNVTGAWEHTGPWTPESRTSIVSTAGGLRWMVPVRFGTLSADGTFRMANTQNVQVGAGSTPRSTQADWWTHAVSANRTNHFVLDGQTLGLHLTYAPFSWWSHELTLGRDQSTSQQRTDVAGYYGPRDSAYEFTQTPAIKRSIDYSTTAQGQLTPWARVIITGGADAWQSLYSTSWQMLTSLTGSLNQIANSASRQPGHNTGAFVQSQLGIADQLFLTYGLRAEWNPDFGQDAQPNLAPRYGIAYSHEAGPVTAKMRASYGRSTRPPAVSQKLGGPPISDPDGLAAWGPVVQFMPNPLLEPSSQKGIEVGLDLYFGQRGSLTITRFNQTVDNLIVQVSGVDSIKSLKPDPYNGLLCSDFSTTGGQDVCSSEDAAGYWYAWTSKNMNVAGIRNQGWELQGKLNFGRFTARGTYSWSRSRSLGLTEKFRALMPSWLSRNPQYVPGASLQYLAEHTWALGTTYAAARATFDVNVNGVGQIWNQLSTLQRDHLSYDVRLMTNQWRMWGPANGAPFLFLNPGYALVDWSATYRLMPWLDGRVDMVNALNRYQNDLSANNPVMGRQTRFGFTVRH